MRDNRAKGSGDFAQVIARWNAQPDQLRAKRLGIAKGIPFNSFVAKSRLPFKLPPGATLFEDGSIKMDGR
jgi:hypothetical protein